MKKMLIICLIIILLVITLTACANEKQPNNNVFKNELDSMNNQEVSSRLAYSFPEKLETIPESYFSPTDNQGTLTELNYKTYESKTYEQKTQTLQKRAIVYLPYGYNENEKYNVFYW